MGKRAAEAENGDLHKLLQEKMEQWEGERQKSEEEVHADEAWKAATSEVRAVVSATDLSLEAKVKSLQAKLLQRVNEAKKLEYELGRERRRVAKAEREREATKTELIKMTTARSKLEALSRELSKQNKLLLEDSEKRMEEEKAKREEIVRKFSEAMVEINRKLEIQSQSRGKQDEEVESLKQKLKDLMAKYEVREEHFAMQLRTKELELELADARVREQKSIAEAAQKGVAELEELTNVQLKTEAELRAQLEEYNEKFDKFQETLDQSNQVFGAYTAEMEKMSKTVKQLQRTNAGLREENNGLKKKSNTTAYQFVSTKAELDDAIKLKKQERDKREKLEKLCRSLTAERATLQKENDALQGAWEALRTDVDRLKDQSDEDKRSSRLWELLQRLVLEDTEGTRNTAHSEDKPLSR